MVFNKVWVRGCLHCLGKNHPVEKKICLVALEMYKYLTLLSRVRLGLCENYYLAKHKCSY